MTSKVVISHTDEAVASHTWLEFMTEHAPAMIWISDAEGRSIRLSRALRDFWGIDAEEMARFEWRDTLHPDDVAAVSAAIQRARHDRDEFHLQLRMRNSRGEYRDIRTDAVPRIAPDGAFQGWIGVNIDVTDSMALERALRESEERFRAVVDTQAEMVCRFGADGTLNFVNRAYAASLNTTAEALTGANLWNFISPEDRAVVHELLSQLTPQAPEIRIENRFQTAQGERWTLWTNRVLSFDEHGRWQEAQSTGIDITDRKRAEDGSRQAAQMQQQLNELLERKVAQVLAERQQTESQLRQAQKMESLGRLTGGVAHDFNNLLQVIGGNLQLLMREVAGHPVAAERVRNALEGVERGAKLAAQLLAFGRRQPLAPKVLNLGRLLRHMDEMLRRTLGEGVEIETVISGGLWNTLVDPSQVESALLNLAINSSDAMNGQGRLTIEVGNAFLGDRYAMEHGLPEGQYVMLAVTDTGSGMTPDVLERVFEPFFTTKPEGRGTGLGLSMVYGFVKQSGGHIKIYSEAGQGTTIRLYLPRVRQEETMLPEIAATPAVGGVETILLVEDDEHVRNTVAAMLMDLGYTVLRAKDAQDAYAVVESGAHIDLLFTDVVMPGPMRSTELARRASERLPGLAILFTSGYTQNAIVHGGRLDEGVELLSKPYNREQLARKVRHVLDARHPESTRSASSVESLDNQPTVRPMCILLVEDEVLIRMSTASLLSDLNHTVIEAGSAGEAMRMFDLHAIDVLIADIGLPDASGIELAALARLRVPRLKVVFATGAEISADELRKGGGSHVVTLLKPYDRDALIRALNACA